MEFANSNHGFASRENTACQRGFAHWWSNAEAVQNWRWVSVINSNNNNNKNKKKTQKSVPRKWNKKKNKNWLHNL